VAQTTRKTPSSPPPPPNHLGESLRFDIQKYEEIKPQNPGPKK
jgi:hypothetical protein